MAHPLRLRRSIRVERAIQPGGGPILRIADPPAGTKFVIDVALLPVLEKLDGTRTTEAIARDAGTPLEATHRLLLSLAFTGCLEGVDDHARSALVDARAIGPSITEDLPFHLVQGTRFKCGACGICCRSYAPGPIGPDEVRRISGAAFLKDDPEYRGKAVFILRSSPLSDGGVTNPAYYVARRQDGSCSFLTKEGRCRIHQELGEEAKPDTCKLFPYVVSPTARALVIFDRTECSTFSKSSAEGVPLEERFNEMRALFRRKALQAGGILAPIVALPGPLAVAHSRFRAVVDRLVELLQREEGPSVFARVEACRNAIARFSILIAAAQPAPGEPDRVVAAFEAIPLEELVGDDAAARSGLAPDPAGRDAALQKIVARFQAPAEVLVRDWDGYRKGGPFPEGAALGQAQADLFRDGLEVLAGKRPAPPCDLADRVIFHALRRGVLQRVHGHELETDTRATAGFARVVLTLLLTVTAARARAAARGATTVTAEDLDLGQVAVTRALCVPMLRDALHHGQPDLDDLFLHAIGLEARANA